MFVAIHPLSHSEDSHLLGLGRRRGTGFPGSLLDLGGRSGEWALRRWEEEQEGLAWTGYPGYVRLHVAICCSWGHVFHLLSHVGVHPLLQTDLPHKSAGTLHCRHPLGLCRPLDTVGTER